MYKKIGLVIADDAEFAPVLQISDELGGEKFTRHGREYCRFFKNGVEFVAIWCKVGKVNAAAMTAALICEEKPECIINFGLSGAVSGVFKNELVLGTKFIEHDFDLTPLGYELGQKPQEKYIFESDPELNNAILNADDSICKGVCVTGDIFITTKEKRDTVVSKFGANCCDMETAAIASVCYDFKLPFASLRYMSDDADDAAITTYRKVNELKKDSMIRIILKAFC